MARNALEQYNEKRDFSLTSEPPGKAARSHLDALIFVVQKHDATRLHYDFRLEWDGVLLSWAVPKGPSYYPAAKRLAVRTEDHPLSYGNFEGIIPEKQYGAGPVMVWDTGTWTPLEPDMTQALKKGKIHFRLDGTKLQGEWTLARMRGKEKDKRENWLLIKSHDDRAIEKDDNTFLKETDYSVKSGRPFAEIAAGSPAKEKTQPNTDIKSLERQYKAPQLATLVDAPPTGRDWVHEIKYDGYRVLVYFADGTVRIRTRRGHDWTDRFPDLRDAFAGLETGSFVLDGEAVVIDEKGLSNFKALQNALDETGAPMQGYFFDLLHWNGTDYTAIPFAARRRALEKLFAIIPDGPLYLSEIIEGKADKVVDQACVLGLEGIISKNKKAPYIQKRTKHWVKSKCEQRQEFIICGFVPATNDAHAVGSLHLGYHRDGALQYAGKVGTGFDTKTAKDLFNRLKRRKAARYPFARKPDTRLGDAVWVEPALLCEVKFMMWTAGGKIRHASYQGLREDKPPGTIIREEPQTMNKKQARKNTRTSKAGATTVVEAVRISHADREIFPQAHITKGDLAAFYAEMAEHIMPGITGRPISVVRCPGGLAKQCFFQRAKGRGMPDHIHRIDITHDGKKHDYFYVQNITGLIELVQMGGSEIHPWGVRIDRTERPDRLIFDLDPDEDIPFEAVKLAAQDVKARLDDLGLQSFLKCTGGKGLHVTAPIQRRHDWDTVKDFARHFAAQMVASVPDAYTINMAKKKRKGKIFIDYLRNDFASTAVMDYCVRARPFAPVAVPLAWEELPALERASQFTLADVRARRDRYELFTPPPVSQNLTQTMINAVKS